MASDKEECKSSYTICFTTETAQIMRDFQNFVKSREKKTTFNKSQTINRIIREWAEDRHFTLELAKKTR